jgi:Zn ribbon nucleic-acid-binding protein
MALKLVECLKCGAARRVANRPSRPSQQDECMRCGYVGWAESETLTETLRRALREHTVEQRRVLPIW